MLTPIALRVLSEDSIGKRKLEANKIYYLSDGFEITNEGSLNISSYRLEKDIIFQDLFDDKDSPDICISAIVGENGSGKSSLIEFYMRLVNNFAAATLGEYQTNPGAQHLHYINNIAGEYYYMIDDIPYRLKVESRNVILESYSATGKISNGVHEYVLYNTANIFDNEMNTLPIDDDIRESPMQEWKFPGLASKSKNDNLLNKLYSHFFYTYISNYSIYAYNTTDYQQESNSDKFEELIRREKKKTYDVEYRNWLNGIFHKNDGYQTPIVLSPFRTKGNININTENLLSRERLITLLVMPKSQFRVINGHLEVTGFKLSNRMIVYNAKYLNQHLGFMRLQQRGFDKFKNLIVNYWGEMVAEDLTKFTEVRKNYETAVGYLVYKTLKISKQYKQYNRFFRDHQNIAYKIDEEALHKLIIRISIDHSHITRKIYQTLAYIVYGKYDYDGDSYVFDIEQTSANTAAIMECEKKKSMSGIGKNFIHSAEELVPPPFYNIQIELRDKDSGHSVLFETLSSGERQQAYSISAFLYHLSNLDSVWKDSNKQRIAYKHINVVMEEIELYFHPELQRTYIKNLLEGIKQIQIPNIKSIHICFVTHSPFVLSDIPSRNILALKINDGEVMEKKHLSTFGANIHDMLKDSFFLTKGSIGAYAELIIKNIIQEMEFAKENKITEDTKIHERIMLIDEPIIRMALLGEYHRIFTQADKEKKIKELQRQMDELKKADMWKLKAPSSELITWYKKTMLDGLYSRIKKIDSTGVPVLEQRIQDVLIPKVEDDKSILRHLLIDKPEESHELCNNLMGQIISGYNENEFTSYLEAKNRGNYRNAAQNDLYQKYSEILKKLLDIFDYDGQLSRNKSRSYRLSMGQGHNTCTYCNRQYVITVNGKNNEERIARPQLDHWFSKELYPLLSLNIYNLIPCCSICNSSIKGNAVFSFDTHVHPYLDSTPDEPAFRFNYKLKEDLTYSVICTNLKDQKEQNMLKAFEIEKLYEYHGELEIKDILLFFKKNPGSYLSYLLSNTLKEYGYTERDVYRMFFGTELDSTENLNRPFSKLKRDILTQLGVLENGHFKA